MWKVGREPVTLIMSRSRRLGNCISNVPYCCDKVPRIDNLREEGLIFLTIWGMTTVHPCGKAVQPRGGE